MDDKDGIPPLDLNDEEFLEFFGAYEPMTDSFAVRFDPRRISGKLDYDWIGEDSEGIWVAVHPEIALIKEDELYDSVISWRCGQNQLNEQDADCLSNFEFAIKTEMFAAMTRKIQREEQAKLENIEMPTKSTRGRRRKKQ